MNRKLAVVLVSIVIVIVPVHEVFAGTFDHSDFDQVVKEYVDDKGFLISIITGH